jgi:S-adenosylmethionine hydrolase
MIVLLTDFGTVDFYVAQMKAVIYKKNTNSTIVDLTHEVEPFNIMHGQFFLQFSYKHFPKNTVFCAVVDPGVGTNRKAVAVNFKNRWFVGPDNGIFSFAKEGQVFEIINNKKNISDTFHGRDIFAPTAAAIDNKQFDNLKKIQSLTISKPITLLDRKGDFQGKVLHIDKFGNIVTNIVAKKDFKATFYIKDKKISTYSKSFEHCNEELFIIEGSSGLLEIVSGNNNANNLLRLSINDKLKVEIL